MSNTTSIKPTHRAIKRRHKPRGHIHAQGVAHESTTRSAYPACEGKLYASSVVAYTDSWAQKLAQTFESTAEVVRYVKNQNLGFTKPHTINGEEHAFTPDFIACLDDSHGQDGVLNLIIEVTSERKKDNAARIAAASTLWATP